MRRMALAHDCRWPASVTNLCRSERERCRYGVQLLLHYSPMLLYRWAASFQDHCDGPRATNRSAPSVVPKLTLQRRSATRLELPTFDSRYWRRLFRSCSGAALITSPSSSPPKPKAATVKNLHAELGSLARMMPTDAGRYAMLIGNLLGGLGPNHVLWGTDTPLIGPPRWQIEAFQSFIMPEALVEQRGYSLLTPEVKDRTFGRNAARIFGIDISAAQGRSALQTSR